MLFKIGSFVKTGLHWKKLWQFLFSGQTLWKWSVFEEDIPSGILLSNTIIEF